MKAIIDIAKRDDVFEAVRKDLAAGGSDDYHLSFETGKMLFSELTPARFDLIDTLHRLGPSSVYALAKAAGRNYSNVHSDVARLLELGLIERTADDAVSVPFDAVEIRMPLAQAA